MEKLNRKQLEKISDEIKHLDSSMNFAIVETELEKNKIYLDRLGKIIGKLTNSYSSVKRRGVEYFKNMACLVYKKHSSRLVNF